jgi:hypothetical protein
MFSIFRRGSAPAAIASHEELQRASETGSSVIVDVREPANLQQDECHERATCLSLSSTPRHFLMIKASS